MNVLIDTHTLLWFLTSDEKLSEKAKNSLLQAEKIYTPTIVLLEFLYLLSKEGKSSEFFPVLKRLKKNPRYIVIALDMAVVEEAVKQAEGLEIHDRIIVATAQMLKATIITKDRKINQLYQKTIW